MFFPGRLRLLSTLKMMKAIEILHPGDADVLRVCERTLPSIRHGEVLIKVHAAGINRPDVFQRKGVYPPPPGASDIPGLEIAGEIVDGDTSGSAFKKGDMVCALVTGGGYAEYCAAPIAQCLPIPKNISVVEAASLPETFFTVWSNIFDRGQLSEKETLLVHGGSSGIGVAAIQIANALGHTVFATAGNDEKCRVCEKLGAKLGVNYKTEDFVTSIKAATSEKGVNVILDMVAGNYINRELGCLADDGRIVIIALLGGSMATVDMSVVQKRRLTITGSTLRPRPVEFKAAIAQKLLANVWPLIEDKSIVPVVYKTFKFSEAASAHKLMESSEHIGKIVLFGW